jgi:Xaa-Pro dipeptidase
MGRTPDELRRRRIADGLAEAGLDAVVCALPANVLLLTGYWPVVGDALALATRQGRIALLAPEDERTLAEAGWADDLRTFKPGSLDALRPLDEVVREPLGEMLREIGPERPRIGYEGGPSSEPASYAGMVLYGPALEALLARLSPTSRREPAGELLKRLRSWKTPGEVGRIRAACEVAGDAFRVGAGQLRPGLKETEAAAVFRTPLETLGTGSRGIARGDGFAYCMSGPNSAEAHGAFARSRDRAIRPGDLALVHCNSYGDGYWTDITRTYSIGDPDRRRPLYDAIFEAREAALAAIRPGSRAADVDRAARDVLRARGFGDQFKHATGHGVGFGAIDPHARPRLHPKSDDILEVGMVFNVEPAIYIDGDCGLRHCDVVAVTEGGFEVLAPFQSRVDELVIA